MDSVVFAYIGPETVIPVTSALAAIGGALLMFGGMIRRLVLRPFRRLRPQEDAPASPPEDG